MNIAKIVRRFFRLPMARATNDTGERIESMRFTVPALRVGVLEYAPGQLQTANTALEGKTVKLYYPPEAVSNKKFLESLEKAPVVVGGHDSTTNENNKKIDGWASHVLYDAAQKAAIINGIVKGNKEIAYIKNNIGVNDFGASAFVDIYDLKIEDGVTPDGQSYNAIACDLRATHVALARHVRDPKNQIKVTNAVVINTDGKINNQEVNSMEMTAEQISALVENAVSRALAVKNEGDRVKELEEEVKNLKAKNEEMAKAEEDAKAKNSEEEEKKKKEEEEGKGSTVENAKPSQALVAALATALNVDFGATTPTFAELAALSGITEKDPYARITAVNAKFAELKATAKSTKTENKVEVF